MAGQILRFEDAFAMAGDGGAAPAPDTAPQPQPQQEPMNFQPSAAPAPGGQQPQIMKFENFFQPSAPGAQPGTDTGGGSQPSLAQPQSGLPAGQGLPAAPSLAGQKIPQTQQTQGPSDLALAGQANSLLQNAGRVGETLAPGLTKDIGGTGANLSDISGPLNVATGALTGNIPQAVGGALSTGNTILRMTDAKGTAVGDAVGGALGVASGGLSIYRGIESGNPGQILTGAGTTLGGLAKIAPETTAEISNALGLGANGIGMVASGIGAIASAYGLYQAIDSGDPIGIAMNLATLYGTSVPVINALFGTALPSLTSLATSAITALSPALASALGLTGATTGATIGATTGTMAGGLAGGMTGGLVALPFIAAYLGISISNAIAAKNRLDDKIFENTQFTHNLKPQLTDLQNFSNKVGDLDAGTPEAARAWLAAGDVWGGQQNTLSQKNVQLSNLENQGPSGMFKSGPSLATKLEPQYVAIALGNVRANDILTRAGEPPRMSPADALLALGSRRYNSSEAGSNAFATKYSAVLERLYRPVYEDNGQGGQYVHHREWVPGAQEFINKNIRPGHYEEDIFNLMGSDVRNMFGSELGVTTNEGIEGKQVLAAQWLPYYESLGMGTGKMMDATKHAVLQEEHRQEAASPAFIAKKAADMATNRAFWDKSFADQAAKAHAAMYDPASISGGGGDGGGGAGGGGGDGAGGGDGGDSE